MRVCASQYWLQAYDAENAEPAEFYEFGECIFWPWLYAIFPPTTHGIFQLRELVQWVI